MESPPALDVEEWTRKVARVWSPKSLHEIRVRTGGGFLFIAGLESGLILHLGVQRDGVDMCALWCGEECVVWDHRLGFCWVFGAVPLSSEKNAAFLNTPLGVLIRRNCFLLGANIEATEEEEGQWNHWLESRENCAQDILALIAASTMQDPPQS